MRFTKNLLALTLLASLSACSAITDFTSSTSSTVDTVTPDVTLNEFVSQRYLAIRQDAANGSGENLDALAKLMGKTDKAAFAKLMQQNFDRIFRDVHQPHEIIARIESSTQATSNRG